MHEWKFEAQAGMWLTITYDNDTAHANHSGCVT